MEYSEVMQPISLFTFTDWLDGTRSGRSGFQNVKVSILFCALDNVTKPPLRAGEPERF